MLTICPACGAQQDTAASTVCTQCGKPLVAGNPYASPQTIQPMGVPFGPRPDAYDLAGRLERFIAMLLDGFIAFAAASPGLAMLAVAAVTSQDVPEPPPMFYVGIGIAMVGALIVSIYQWIIISRDGQSIAKKMMKIRIVLVNTGQPPGFVNGVLLRIWVNSVLSGLPFCIGTVYWLTDCCFIFREDRRCVHDLLAQTVVIKA